MLFRSDVSTPEAAASVAAPSAAAVVSVFAASVAAAVVSVLLELLPQAVRERAIAAAIASDTTLFLIKLLLFSFLILS